LINFKSIIFVSIIFIIYIFSFLNFIKDLDGENISYTESKAIVVLTGNSGRLKAAIDLMEMNTETRLLITGVANGVKYSEIIKNKNIDPRRIDLGYNAKSTYGNVIESQNWIIKNNFKNIILVTDDWHMKRALVLFKNTMPDIKIFPYKLYSKGSTYKEHLIFEEHLKYIISHLQVIYLWIIS
jgi:uncharacterized SAM-binding protein YcdF (DUF218 family)